jgi:hypothetical protein
MPLLRAVVATNDRLAAVMRREVEGVVGRQVVPGVGRT